MLVQEDRKEQMTLKNPSTMCELNLSTYFITIYNVVCFPEFTITVYSQSKKYIDRDYQK